MRVDISGRIKKALNGAVGNDLSKLGEGVSREVYRINTDRFGSQYKGKVIKYPRRDMDRRDNQKEFKTWMSVKGTSIESNFCPIRDRSDDYEFIVMDYARPVGSFRKSDYSELRLDIKDSIRTTEAFDFHHGNVGLHSRFGEVMIDYPWGGNFQVID